MSLFSLLFFFISLLLSSFFFFSSPSFLHLLVLHPPFVLPLLFLPFFQVPLHKKKPEWGKVKWAAMIAQNFEKKHFKKHRDKNQEDFFWNTLTELHCCSRKWRWCSHERHALFAFRSRRHQTARCRHRWGRRGHSPHRCGSTGGYSQMCRYSTWCLWCRADNGERERERERERKRERERTRTIGI